MFLKQSWSFFSIVFFYFLSHFDQNVEPLTKKNLPYFYRKTSGVFRTEIIKIIELFLLKSVAHKKISNFFYGCGIIIKVYKSQCNGQRIWSKLNSKQWIPTIRYCCFQMVTSVAWTNSAIVMGWFWSCTNYCLYTLYLYSGIPSDGWL